MRKLVILRGVMGSGKSTFIKSHNLEPYTLSSDNLRLLFSTFELGVDYKEHIPQFNNQKVWKLLFYLLEERILIYTDFITLPLILNLMVIIAKLI